MKNIWKITTRYINIWCLQRNKLDCLGSTKYAPKGKTPCQVNFGWKRNISFPDCDINDFKVFYEGLRKIVVSLEMENFQQLSSDPLMKI